MKKDELEEDFELDGEDLEEETEEVGVEEEAKESEFEESVILEKPTLNLNLNNLDFDQFTPSVREINSTPVLESIESRIDRPGFVQMGTLSPASRDSLSSEDGRTDTYIPGQEKNDGGPKYIQPEREMGTNIERINMQNLGRDVGGFNVSSPENFFISSESDFQSRNVERVGLQPERVDMQNLGRQKSEFEREEVKYKEHRKYDS